MTEPEVAEAGEGEETEASEFAGEKEEEDIATTDASGTEDVAAEVATLEIGDGTDFRRGADATNNADDEERKHSWIERCVDERWLSEGEPLWRIYMKSYAESLEEDAQRTTTSDVARFSRAEAVDEAPSMYDCFPLGGFRLERTTGKPTGPPDRRERTRIWTSMRTRRSISSTKVSRRARKVSRTGSGKWPSVWPCVSRDATSELRARGGRRGGRGKRRDVFPCDPAVDVDDDDDDEPLSRDFANRKELGHVRAPVACPETKSKLSVDRAVGERAGLVDGDYVVAELSPVESDRRVHVYVVLRGSKGMHLPELGPLRERRETWKFCLYQAIAALLAKTQLRYKYAWSANIDYIYDHAWTLYTHVGAINVKERQRMDDVVVYNYKYAIEIEMIREMRDAVPVARNVDFNYSEGDSRRQITLRRKDPLKVRVEVGCEKLTHPGRVPVHEDVRRIEEWFDKLAGRYRDCIFRTSRFSLAFWQDGLFWYVYNPYRCDEFGFWDDGGRACIVKFCTKDSLRRHLMILLLRAYAYEAPRSRDPRATVGDVYVVQIFRVTFRHCRLQNLKLLERRAPETPRRDVDDDDDDDECTSSYEEVDDDDDDPREPRESPTWLKRHRVTWGSVTTADNARRKGRTTVKVNAKAKWHQYYVEEHNRLFSLWGEIHITDAMFDVANRGMQTYACYVVCAGMTRITAPEYWTRKTLDAIVVCGDRYYSLSRREAELRSVRSDKCRWNDGEYLADGFTIGEILFEVRMSPAVRGRLYGGSRDCLSRSLERLFADRRRFFAILTCENVCLGLFKFCGAYYMCDVNSFGPPLFSYGNGVAYLLRATSFRKFVTTLVLTIGTPERCRFDLNPVEILGIVQVDDDARESRARRTRSADRRRRRFAGKVVRDGPERRRKK